MSAPGMVIVGAGEAGARAALALREAGYGGAVTLIGEEPHAPYERPPLSKAAMTCAETPVPKFVFGEARCDEAGILHLAHARAVAIDRADHRVRLEDGRDIPYERLLLATGAQARRLVDSRRRARALLCAASPTRSACGRGLCRAPGSS